MTSHPAPRFFDRTTPPHMFTLVMLAGLSALNMSLFLPSLNTIAAEYGVDYSVMQLAVSGYFAATAIMQIIVGPISDRFGRRPVVLGGFAIFTLASAGAALAPTGAAFLGFRLVQATVATGMVLSRAVVRDLVSQDKAASMIGYVTLGMSIMPMIGPFIGGAVDEFLGWRANFWLLTGMGLLMVVLAWADQGETVRDRGLPFREQVRQYPALLGSPRFWGYVLCTAFAAGAYYALLGGASLVASGVFGLTPLQTGLALGSPTVGYALGNYLSGRYSVRFGVNRMTLVGTGVASAGLAVSMAISLAGQESALLFFGFCTFLGLGNGLTMPNATAGMLSVRPHLAGTASGLGGAIMVTGGAALSAVAGASLSPEAGSLPLQAIMFGSSVLSGVAIGFVIWREKRLGIE
ncbi:MAG: Bcr/CflA family efflux MFS transporter [Rhodobacteraceae bacterium]|jgi:DHA1 family bicyclomycin/chloramphenicol resistance-like MFS transporter|nr:Bcr/CflA family efflux MFS transporter [Paracoccaceae bacterium]